MYHRKTLEKFVTFKIFDTATTFIFLQDNPTFQLNCWAEKSKCDIVIPPWFMLWIHCSFVISYPHYQKHPCYGFALEMRGPFHKYANSKPTQLPTALSNITTGDSKYPQSSSVRGLWRREVFRRQWCVYLSSCGEPTTATCTRLWGDCWDFPRDHRLTANDLQRRQLRDAQQQHRSWYILHTPHTPQPPSSNRTWRERAAKLSAAQESWSLKLASVLTKNSGDIERTRAFRTFKKTKELMWHKMNI